jgi:5-methylthioribose kinase
VGTSWPLTRQRMEHEVAALRRFGALCPQHVPQVYHADSKLFLMVMQRLSSHRILRQCLMDGIVFPLLGDHLSTYLARTLFFGSDLFLAPNVKKQAASAAENDELCKITEDLVFTYPFQHHPSNVYSPRLPQSAIDRLRNTTALRVAAGEMKWAFMNHAETLVHGDLHTGSIMVNQDETFVIDPECAFYGPMGFDVGAVLANLWLAYFSRDWHGRLEGKSPENYQHWLLEQASRIWTGFSAKFLDLWRGHESRSSLGFAGCKMIRRIVGMAKVAEITSIPDDSVRAAIEVRCLRFAEALLVQRQAFGSIEEVVALARDIQAQRGDAA